MGRAPCCDKDSVKRGPWSLEEDVTLKSYIENHGTGGNWMALPRKAGLRRCGKSCRLRWLNYLRPDIKHGGFTEEEDNIIFTLYSQMGSRWSVIAAQLPGRTDNEVKNYWNTKLKKKKQLLTGNSSATAKSDKMIYSHDHIFTAARAIQIQFNYTARASWMFRNLVQLQRTVLVLSLFRCLKTKNVQATSHIRLLLVSIICPSHEDAHDKRQYTYIPTACLPVSCLSSDHECCMVFWLMQKRFSLSLSLSDLISAGLQPKYMHSHN
ncbi:hypothetical protein CIPAW_15G043000 [Carya illinoinensis]|uniref:Uncharacterized protein n=1 Tax=Carya illinoinensis TaxID=32201 RepID=A0A8T1NA24_CARIL|nr:hypothetical protein CIPAW_15G043000 [Carya illinoinensis]